MKKIGITGGTGLLGKLLVKELKKKKIGYSLFKKDIVNKKSVINWVSKNNNIEYIFHFAAYSTANNSNQNKLKAFKINVKGTENLLKAIKLKKKKIIIFFSSSSHVYNYSNKPIKENFRLNPKNYYAKTKVMAENKIIKSDNKYLKYCIGRIFSIYHKNQKRPFLYPTMKHKLKIIKSDKVQVNGANNIRDFSNAEQIVKVIMKIFNKRLTGVYNIGSGKGMTVRKFINNYVDKKKIIIDNKKPNSLIANINKLQKKLI